MYGSNSARPDRGIRRRCRELVSLLPVADPFDTTALVDAVAASTGQPITLVPTTVQLNGVCGALIVTADQTYIFYPAETSPVHQQHVLFHEIGHLLCPDHQGPLGMIETLTPNLSPDLVQRVLGRSAYTGRQEQEAELIATLIAQRARGAPGPLARPVTSGPVATIFDPPPPQPLSYGSTADPP